MKKKILMLLTRNPYPVDNGRKSILAQTISFLKDDYEICTLVFANEEIDFETYKQHGVSEVQRLFLPSKLEMIKNMICMSKSSLQERIYYSEKAKKDIEYAIKEFNPDILYADMIRTAQYIEDKEKSKIVDIDDLLSIRYQRFIMDQESSILGTFNHLIPPVIRYTLETFFKNIILNYEIQLISVREREIVKKFDASFLVSKKETNAFKQETLLNNIYVNTQAISLRKNIYSQHTENHMVFIGNMSTAQNLSSLKMIVHEILPALKTKYKLFVIGKYDIRTTKIVKDNKNIELLGYVENLENALKNIKLAFMPISFGSGIKTKILDCMSYGIPVLTNDVGNEGLSTQNLKDIILLENNELSYNKLVDMLDDTEKLDSIGQEGYKYIEKNHNFENLKLNFLNVLKRI